MFIVLVDFVKGQSKLMIRLSFTILATLEVVFFIHNTLCSCNDYPLRSIIRFTAVLDQQLLHITHV